MESRQITLTYMVYGDTAGNGFCSPLRIHYIRFQERIALFIGELCFKNGEQTIKALRMFDDVLLQQYRHGAEGDFKTDPFLSSIILSIIEGIKTMLVHEGMDIVIGLDIESPAEPRFTKMVLQSLNNKQVELTFDGPSLAHLGLYFLKAKQCGLAYWFFSKSLRLQPGSTIAEKIDYEKRILLRLVTTSIYAIKSGGRVTPELVMLIAAVRGTKFAQGLITQKETASSDFHEKLKQRESTISGLTEQLPVVNMRRLVHVI